MSQYARIEVIDRDGWRKEFPLERPIVHIGSNPRSDLVLEPGRGTGVAPLHVQLIVSTQSSGCQLVNLGNTDILLGPPDDQSLPPRSVIRIVNGTAFKLGDFTLVFYGDEDEGTSDSFTSHSNNIGLDLSLPQTRLAANQALGGVVVVSNLGDQTGVQFNLKLEGLEHDCYNIEPGPLLPPGADRGVSFHIYHRGNKPLAGDCRITVRATAPRAYPGEQATVSRVIQVLPFYRHKLHLVSPAGVSPSLWVRDVPKPPQPEVSMPLEAERALQAEAVAPLQATEEEAPKAEVDALLQTEDWAAVADADRRRPDSGRKAETGTLLETEQEPRAEAGLPALVEEERAPEAETVAPAQIEGRWAPGPGPEEQAEEREVLTLKVSPPPETEAEPELTAEASPPSSTKDWWSSEVKVGPEEHVEGRQVLKLKASPPPETEAEPAQAKASLPPSAEDWWLSEDQGDPEPQTEEHRVLKLKASPPPETETEPAQVTSPPSAEDWWTPEAQVGPENQ